MIPRAIRVDRGTKTDIITDIHCRFHQLLEIFDKDVLLDQAVVYGPSTANKIERWWRELHHRMETFFKEQLQFLLNNGHYDQTDKLDRYFNTFYLSLLNYFSAVVFFLASRNFTKIQKEKLFRHN